MRGLYLGLALAGVMLMAQPAAAAETLATCAPPGNPFDKAVCSHADLRALSRQIDDRVGQLRGRYKGEDRRVFDVEYKRWRDNEYLCIVASHEGEEYGCLRDDFDARLKLLADLASGSKEIQEVAASYTQVKPWYVNALPKQYEGRAVIVDGAIYLKGCYKPGMPHSGLIGYPKWALRHDWRPVPYTPKTVSIEIRFDRISSQVAGRICETYDADSTGTVMLDHGRPYIYVPELF